MVLKELYWIVLERDFFEFFTVIILDISSLAILYSIATNLEASLALNK